MSVLCCGRSSDDSVRWLTVDVENDADARGVGAARVEWQASRRYLTDQNNRGARGKLPVGKIDEGETTASPGGFPNPRLSVWQGWMLGENNNTNLADG